MSQMFYQDVEYTRCIRGDAMKVIIFVIMVFINMLFPFNVFSADDDIDINSVRKIIDSGDKTYTLVDVREPSELIGPLGHIKGVINIPLNNIISDPFVLNPYKDTTIIFICRTGHRSRLAADKAGLAGFAALNMLGGMTAWKEAGYPVLYN